MPKFKGYNGEKYTVDPAEKINEKDSIVRIKITTQNSSIINLELKIRNYGDHFKILNITAEGIDMAKSSINIKSLFKKKLSITRKTFRKCKKPNHNAMNILRINIRNSQCIFNNEISSWLNDFSH